MALREDMYKKLMSSDKSSETEDEESHSSSSTSPRLDSLEASESPVMSSSERPHSSVRPRPTSPTSQLGKKTSGAGMQQDMRAWKKILLQWISECKFVEQNYFNIEQTNIDDFYKELRKCMLPPENTTEATEGTLIEFLKENYKDFEPHLDDDNELSSADYVYVYSLLLHYSCIKKPHGYVHDACKKLSNQTQTVVASFFNSLLQYDYVNRDNIRNSIANVAENLSLKSDSSGGSSLNNSSPSFSALESPIRTPRKCPTGYKISPSTPKSFLLEEQTRELISLRAQIETERYEKGLLEVQIKQFEDSIEKFHREHRKVVQELKDVKSNLLVQKTETDSCKKVDDDQIKRRLIKEISQKESEITILAEKISILEEDKAMAQEKMKFSQDQTESCMQRIIELENKIGMLNQTVKDNDATIAALIDNNSELKRHIDEMKADEEKSDLNYSIDFLDNSFARTTNNSDSTNSPENLAASVIDKQFKALQKENQNLKEFNRDFAKNIYKVLFSYCEEMKSLKDEEDADDFDENFKEMMGKIYEKDLDEVDDVSDGFEIFCVFFTKLNECFLSEREYAKRLKEQHLKLIRANKDLNEKVGKVQAEIEDLQEKAVSLAVANEKMEMEKSAMAAKLDETENALIVMKSQKDDLNNKLKEKQKDYQQYKENVEKEIKEFKMQTLSVSENNFHLDEKNRKLQNDILALNIKYENIIKEYDTSINDLTSTLTRAREELNEYEKRQTGSNNELTELRVYIKKLENSSEEKAKHIDSFTENLREKQDMIKYLGSQIVEMKDKNEELDSNLKELQMKYNLASEMHSNQMNQLNQENQDLRTAIRDVESKLDKKMKFEESYNNAKDKLKSSEKYIADVFVKMRKDIPSDNIVINCQEIVYFVTKLVTDNSKLNEKLNEVEFIAKEHSILHTKSEQKKVELQLQCETLTDNNAKCLIEIDQLKRSYNDIKDENGILETRIKELIREHDNIINQREKEFEKLLNDKQNEYEKGTSELEEAVKILEQIIRITIDEKDKKIIELSRESESLSSKHEQELKNLNLHIRKQDHDLKNSLEIRKKLENSLEEKENNIKQSNKLYNELEKKKDTLTSQLKAAEKNLKSSQENFDLIKKDFENQKSSLKSAQDMISTLKGEMDERNQTLKLLQKEKDGLINQVENFKAKYSESLNEKTIISHTFNEIKMRFIETEKEQNEKTSELESTIKEIAQSNHEISNVNRKLQADILAKDKELAKHVTEKLNLEKDLLEKNSSLLSEKDNLKKSLDFIKKSVDEIHQILNSFLSKTIIVDNEDNECRSFDYFVNIKNHSDSFDSSCSSLVANVTEILNQILNNHKNLLHELNSVKEQTLLLEKNSQVLTRLKDQWEEDLKIKNQEIVEQEAKLLSRIELLNEEKESKERSIKKYNEDLELAERKIVDFETAIYKLNVGFNKLKIEKDDLKNDIIKANQQYETEKQQWQELIKVAEERYSKLKIENTQINLEISELNSAKSELETQIKNLSNLYTEVLEKDENKQSRIDELLKSDQEHQEQIETLEKSLKDKVNEIITLKSHKSKLEDDMKNLVITKEEFSQKLDEFKAQNYNLKDKIVELSSFSDKNNHSIDVLKTQFDSCSQQNQHLLSDIEILKKEKENLLIELKDKEKDISKANDNLSKMIEELTLIRREKEKSINENQFLLKQLSDTSKNYDTSEHKLKEHIDSIQILERKVSTLQKDNDSLNDLFKKSKITEDKLYSDNMKLRETSDNHMKRIEKLSLQLGDLQARNNKLEKDLTKTNHSLEICNSTLETLQKDKVSLQQENKSLKESKSCLQKSEEQLQQKYKLLEKANATLTEEKNRLEELENENSMKMKKLEKQRQVLEDKNRSSTQALEFTEKEKTELILQVGALNSQINELQNLKKQQEARLSELSKMLQETKETLETLQEKSSKLRLNKDSLAEQNSSLSDKLAKAKLALQIAEQKYDKTLKELENIRSEFLILRQEKSDEEAKYIALSKEYSEFKLASDLSNTENSNYLKGVHNEIISLKKDIDEKNEQMKVMKKDLDDFYNQPVGPQKEDLDALRSRLTTLETDLADAMKCNAKLRSDNQILQAKYSESKKRVQDEVENTGERIKQYRIEMEGKLEKMKAKMVTLYNEGTNKMKSKHEDEMALLKTERDQLQNKNQKYEEHTKKLSKEIVDLNDRISQLQTENTFIITKLKHLEEKENQIHYHSTLPRSSSSIFEIPPNQSNNLPKRPVSAHMKPPAAPLSSSQTSASTQSSTKVLMPAPTSRNIVTNLAMEDEEGEIFNNTYLTDMKNGRMSEIFNPRVGPEEIRYRNSLAPPHLRSSYAAQYADIDVGEDDIKDISPNFDDSLSALLTSTASGNSRKKCSGSTHYKRPGPPTPSKHGRLSFGGNTEPPREILKENNDVANIGKTPARFSNFLSRLSMSNTKEEFPDRTTVCKNLRKALHKNRLASGVTIFALNESPFENKKEDDGNGNRELLERKMSKGGICTSTPRKSRDANEDIKPSILCPLSVKTSPLICKRPSQLWKRRNALKLETQNDGTPLSALIRQSSDTKIHSANALRKASKPHYSPAKNVSSSIKKHLKKRLLNKLMEVLLTPSAGDTTTTTNSPCSSNASDRDHCRIPNIDLNNIISNAGLDNEDVINSLKRQHKKSLHLKSKNRSNRRVSLNMHGNMFAKYNHRRLSIIGASSSSGGKAFRDLKRVSHIRKKRKERCDDFIKNRCISSEQSCDNGDDDNNNDAANDSCYDLTNNNYSRINHNLNETIVIIKSENISGLPEIHSIEEDSVGENENESSQVEEITNDNPSFLIEDSNPSCSSNKFFHLQKELKETFQVAETNNEIDVNKLMQPEVKNELITTQELIEFDRKHLAQMRQEAIKSFTSDHQINKTNDINFQQTGDMQHFEHLLTQTQSQAPFEVKVVKYDPSSSSTNEGSTNSSHPEQQTSQASTNSHSHSSFQKVTLPSSTVLSPSFHFQHSLEQPLPPQAFHQNHQSGHLSRTIYGGSVIVNRRLPNINTEFVRKSSIYIKNHDTAGNEDIILVTNQTITFMDLFRMWHQMNPSTQVIIAFAICASLTTILSFISSYFR